ncbi:hypothetical protein LZ30DRAFT_114115 [Colletotrichum cereale]|nr:hypothetical protein LZ30DRAFT_114115 [Colletotrichum cereale]
MSNARKVCVEARDDWKSQSCGRDGYAHARSWHLEELWPAEPRGSRFSLTGHEDIHFFIFFWLGKRWWMWIVKAKHRGGVGLELCGKCVWNPFPLFNHRKGKEALQSHARRCATTTRLQIISSKLPPPKSSRSASCSVSSTQRQPMDLTFAPPYGSEVDGPSASSAKGMPRRVDRGRAEIWDMGEMNKGASGQSQEPRDPRTRGPEDPRGAGDR